MSSFLTFFVGILNCASAEIFLKALGPIKVRLAGKLTLLKPVQSKKAFSPILVRLAGKMTSVKPVQPQKAHSPISVRLVHTDKSIFAKSVQ